MSEIKQKICEHFGVENDEATIIVNKAIAGGEINANCSAEEWFDERLFPNSVLIDETGYAKMCVDALKILTKTVPTDYGSSRQRDLGHERGTLDDYLPSDIHSIWDPKLNKDRTPRLKIGIKTVKWNGPIQQSNDFEKIKTLKQVVGTVKLEGIGTLSHDGGYLFNTGNLLWKDIEWEKFKAEI